MANRTEIQPPWPDETLAIPRRTGGGLRVVSGLKLATTPREPAHQWQVIGESLPGLFDVWHVCWDGRGFVSDRAVRGLDYGAAVHRMFLRAMPHLPAPLVPQYGTEPGE